MMSALLFLCVGLTGCNQSARTQGKEQAREPAFGSLPVRSRADVRSFFAFGQDMAWVLTWDLRLYFTSDHGGTWELKSRNDGKETTLIFFSNVDDGWAIAKYGQVSRTYDGGRSWELIARIPPNQYEEKQFAPLGVKFFNKRQGLVMSLTILWLTDDGGKTWRRSSPGRGLEGHYGNLSGFSSLDGNEIWVTSATGVFRSTDGGMLWRTMKLTPDQGLYDDATHVQWLDSRHGFIYLDVPYSTVDGGMTWRNIYPEDVYFRSVLSVHFTDPDEGWMTGEDGISASLKEWQVTGKKKGILLHTTDGGKSWERVISAGEDLYREVVFTDKLNGWLVADHAVRHTSDGGQTWNFSSWK